MKQDTNIESAFQVPRWMTPSDARARLDREIDDFVGKAAAAVAAPDAAMVLKVTAGLGKTATTLHAIARHGEALLGLGHVLFYVPTLELAERACKDFRRLAPGLPCRVVRGRDALRPDDPEKTMCERAEMARAVADFVPSITQALCRARDNEGNFVMSACAKGCPYLDQKDTKGPHIVFLSHNYLTVDPPIDREWPVALRIIDEKVWPTLTRTSHLSIDDLLRAPPASYPVHLHDMLARARMALVEGLQRDLPLHDHLRCSGFDTAQLEDLAQAEGQSRNHLDIGPWQSTQALEFKVKTFDKKSFIASRRRERIFKRLSEKEAGHCVGLMMCEVKTENSSQRLIKSSRIKDVDRDAPLLLLDADADRDITERLVPGAAFISIQSPPIADIIQVSDRTLSNSWLLHPEDGKRRRAAVLKILAREVDRAAGGGVMVVATKAVLVALHGDTGHTVVGDDDESLRQPLLKRYALAVGDLLLTEGGDPDKLGRGTVWNNEIPGAIHQNHIFRVRVTDEKVQPIFLSHLLSSPYGRGYFLRMAKQTTGIASINKTQLSGFPTILPNEGEQIEFAQRLKSYQDQKERYIAHLGEVDGLFATLQSCAFAGAL